MSLQVDKEVGTLKRSAGQAQERVAALASQLDAQRTTFNQELFAAQQETDAVGHVHAGTKFPSLRLVICFLFAASGVPVHSEVFPSCWQ